MEPKKHYLAYRRLVNIACANFRPKAGAILLSLRLSPDEVDLVKSSTRDVRTVGQGVKRWTRQWNPALRAFDIAFADRLTTAQQ